MSRTRPTSASMDSINQYGSSSRVTPKATEVVKKTATDDVVAFVIFCRSSWLKDALETAPPVASWRRMPDRGSEGQFPRCGGGGVPVRSEDPVPLIRVGERPLGSTARSTAWHGDL